MKARNIDQRNWEKALSWDAYVTKIEALANAGKSTGNLDPEVGVSYTQLNWQRMQRWAKKMVIEEDVLTLFRNVKHEQHWLVLTESWCGDAAQSLPFIAAVAAINPKLQLRLLWRDENEPIIDAYLTNGKSRSIPRLIAFAPDLEELFTWGPRPKPLQVLVEKKLTEGVPYKAFSADVQKWYNKDKGATIVHELAELVRSADQVLLK